MSLIDVETFVPKVIHNGYAIMLVRVMECATCGKLMVNKPKSREDLEQNIFPAYISVSFENQLKRANWVQQSSAKVDGRYVCMECVVAGRVEFLCALCKDRKSSDKEQASFGDPPEFLCSDCFTTVTAQIWDQKVDELEKRHRWDFE